MKICFFTENYYKGGVDTFLINLINFWPDDKDEITLVCNSTHPGLDTIENKTKRFFSIHRYHYLFTSQITSGQSKYSFFRTRAIVYFFKILRRLLEYPILFPWYLISLTYFFQRSNYDHLMVINGGYPASLLCRTAAIAWNFAGKRPLAIFNFHNFVQKAHPLFTFIERMVDTLVYNSSSAIVSVSQSCLNSLSSRPVFKYPKLKYILNGIEDPIKIANQNTFNPEFNIENCDYCLILATYEQRKGHPYLLTAFKEVIVKYPNLQLHIFGYGSPSEKKKVSDIRDALLLNKNVFLHNFTDQTGPLIKNAKALLVPSQSYESFGLTIIEAMAWGTPVVVTDVGGMPEVLKDSGAGFVCSRDNPLEFASRIKEIIESPSLAAELSRNGRRTFEKKFTARRMAAEYHLLVKKSKCVESNEE